MKLANSSTHIRLRQPWEAVDLGFALVQHNARQLFPAWLLLVFSFVALLWWLLPQDYLSLAPLILWWLKPLYDRVLLHILSRQLFGEQLTLAEVFHALPWLLRHTGLLGALTWRRLSLSRGFNLPIWQLEQLRGQVRRQRQNLLHQHTHQQAVWLTIACVHLEYVVIASLYTLLVLFDPTGESVTFLWENVFLTADNDAQYWANLLGLFTYVSAIAIIEPLYVAASFSLYLNRRTQLEAWDIELAFRQIGARLAKLTQGSLAVLLTLTLSLTLLLPAHHAYAADEYLAYERLPADKSAEQIRAVLQAEELAGMRTVQRWQFKDTDTHTTVEATPQWLENLRLLFANTTEMLLWLAVAFLLILAFVYRKALLALLQQPRQQATPAAPPDVLFGMDIRPESLPSDIAASCRTLWQQGQHRAALSLLYRAALMHLTRHEQLAVHSSHTEGDILQLAKPHLSPQRLGWLTLLTHVWQQTAYAHRIPSNTQAEQLFNDWQRFQQAEASP